MAYIDSLMEDLDLDDKLELMETLVSEKISEIMASHKAELAKEGETGDKKKEARSKDSSSSDDMSDETAWKIVVGASLVAIGLMLLVTYCACCRSSKSKKDEPLLIQEQHPEMAS